MKIALFSDIHANLPALEACLASIDARKVDAIYCLGDLVGYNVWPNEVTDMIRSRGIPVIAGNYDEGIGAMSDECGCAYKTDGEKDNGKISISYTNNLVGPEQRAYLRSLPSHIRVEYRFDGQASDLLLVHGSPRRINEYLFEDREEKSLLRIMQDARADILCCGHTHKPWHRVLTEETTSGMRYRHAINIGSVGKPKDGDPRGCYVILTIGADDPTLSPDNLGVEFVRFEYDVEKAARAVEDSPLPDAFAEMLRKGV
jgi:putative phosphoesterase